MGRPNKPHLTMNSPKKVSTQSLTDHKTEFIEFALSLMGIDLDYKTFRKMSAEERNQFLIAHLRERKLGKIT